MVTAPATDTGPDEGRTVVFCDTCGGHVGITGSLGEHCDDETHARKVEHWDADKVRFWNRYYAREARTQKMYADAETVRLSTPLMFRLRDCGVQVMSDGVPSVFPADWRDAHDAADVIDELLTLSTQLADPATRDIAALRLAQLGAELHHGATTPGTGHPGDCTQQSVGNDSMDHHATDRTRTNHG